MIEDVARQRQSALAVSTADYVTRIGEDPLSEGFSTAALAEGLERGLIRRDPERQIGINTVSTDAQGERFFHCWRDTSAARRMFDATIADANPQRMPNGSGCWRTSPPQRHRARLSICPANLRHSVSHSAQCPDHRFARPANLCRAADCL